MKRCFAWSEEWASRSIATPQGPMVARRGQIVVVAIVDDWEAAGGVLALLDKRDNHGAKT